LPPPRSTGYPRLHSQTTMRHILVLGIACLLAATVNAKGAFEGTDKNFESAVMQSGKNVFVKFLAPW